MEYNEWTNKDIISHRLKGALAKEVLFSFVKLSFASGAVSRLTLLKLSDILGKVIELFFNYIYLGYLMTDEHFL